MAKNTLKDVLSDAHAHFYILKGEQIERLRMWEITDDAIVIDVPTDVPMRKTILGFIPTLMGNAIYEVEGEVSNEEIPNQMENTILVKIKPGNARRVNRRLYPRFNFAPPAKVIISNENNIEGIDGKLINISGGGVRVEVAKQLPANVDHMFEFEIEVDDETHAMALIGTVVYEIPLDNGYAYGVRFGVANPEEAAPTDEVSVKALDKTIDLLGLVNKLLVRGKGEE
ncbi:MAG: PilZ domain-containing protein [Deltaproteobacteria bacterium]|jgi:hypothetical protein|nr:PilZ domain-containing protein [Deltaproteobacteria bacterium]